MLSRWFGQFENRVIKWRASANGDSILCCFGVLIVLGQVRSSTSAMINALIPHRAFVRCRFVFQLHYIPEENNCSRINQPVVVIN